MNDLNPCSRSRDQMSIVKAISAPAGREARDRHADRIASPLAGPVAPQDGYTIRYRVL